MAGIVVIKKPKTVIHKTIYEYCKEDINVELEALDIAKRLGIITADDLHVLDLSVEKLGLTTNVYGPTLLNLAKRGNLKLIGYVPSRRRESHHRRIGEYKYVKG